MDEVLKELERIHDIYKRIRVKNKKDFNDKYWDQFNVGTLNGIEIAIREIKKAQKKED